MDVADLIVVLPVFHRPHHSAAQAVVDDRAPRRVAGLQRLDRQVPLAGRISLIRTGLHLPKATVLDQRRSTLFLRDTQQTSRGWLLAVMNAVEAIGRPEFTLDDIYAHEASLSALYPGNNNVHPKIRQQLQVLRDPGSSPGWLAGFQRTRDVSAGLTHRLLPVRRLANGEGDREAVEGVLKRLRR